MAIAENTAVLAHAIIKQRDARDPLGIFVNRHLITGDASGGTIKVSIAAAQTYHIYALTAFTLSVQTLAADSIGKLRLLTNYPPALPDGGLSAFAWNRVFIISNTSMTAPGDSMGISQGAIGLETGKVLMFGGDFQTVVPQNIIELEIEDNILNQSYFFEVYGYFWDRSSILVPGGPRLPLV